MRIAVQKKKRIVHKFPGLLRARRIKAVNENKLPRLNLLLKQLGIMTSAFVILGFVFALV
jgi:hypothetical protein